MKQLINDEIFYVGVSDRRIKDFENYIPLTNGVSYNSYLILDEKTCLLDTVDATKASQFFKNVEEVLAGRNLDYLMIHHMEPDHCALIAEVVLRYPDVTLVANIQVFKMLYQFFGTEYKNKLVIKENDTLVLGKHTLKFISAPMVHWPEVMFSYDLTTKTLFSADAFGSFGALAGNLFYDQVVDTDYFNEARRYYANIVGKYGNSVCNACRKIKDLEIKMICPLHSYIWRQDFSLLLDKYLKWATYQPEDKNVVIFYASMYGNTEEVANNLAVALANKGLNNIKEYDISQTDETYLISEIFRTSHIVLLCPTYNLGIYPKMQQLLHAMQSLNVSNRTFALIENGTWGPITNKLISEELQKLTNITILEKKITIRSSMSKDNEKDIDELATMLIEDLQNK